MKYHFRSAEYHKAGTLLVSRELEVGTYIIIIHVNNLWMVTLYKPTRLYMHVGYTFCRCELTLPSSHCEPDRDDYASPPVAQCSLIRYFGQWEIVAVLPNSFVIVPMWLLPIVANSNPERRYGAHERQRREGTCNCSTIRILIDDMFPVSTSLH